MSILKIALLGPPEVFHFDQRLMFSDRKALALLAYLAAEGGMHERQRLSRLLWPESDAAHGRTTLRITLHHLRHRLEEGAQLEDESHLLITHGTLGLNMGSGIDLDLHTLQSAWSIAQDQAAREEGQGEIRRTMIAQLQHAVALYRGSFLEDFTLRDTVDFDNWVGIQNGYWYQRIEQVFDWLSQLQRAEGEIEQAIATVEHWRSFDPLNEDISLRLMQLYFAIGNRVAALRAYETYQDILMKELQAKPSPRMVAQAEFMRTATTRSSTREQIGTHPPSAGSLLEIPFVGRGAEISRLMSLYERASHGQPQVVVIEGEAGIGKSRLAAAFLDWARAQGAGVLEGRAFKSYQHLAYQPLLDPLRTRLGQEQDLRQLLGDIWLGELSRLFPELRERYPDLPPSTVDEAFEASRFFEALARLGQAYAVRAPLLIFIDDLQWTDKATLDLFQYLGRQWTERSLPVMLLFNRRVETRSMDTWLVEWLAHLKRDVPLTRLELEPLSAKDILQIVQSVSGKNGEPQAGHREHPSPRLSSRSLQVPARGTVKLAFRWSMVAGDEAMAVFAVRDAIGHFEQARQLADEHKMDVPVTNLHHLFSQLGRAYEIRNDAKAAQATYQTMLETARRIHAPEMECIALNRQAVLESENFFRLEQALAFLQEALEVAERNNDRLGLAETYWSLARVNYYVLNLSASLVYGRQAYPLARELGKPDLLVRVLNVLSYTTKALGQWEESASLAEEAWQLAVQHGNRIMEADCLARVADARINFGQPDEGVTAARAAYALSLEIEHTWSQALCGYTLARGLLEVGSYEEALAIALQSTEVAHTLTFSVLLLVSRLTLGLVYQALQLPEKALQTNLESLSIAESVSASRYIAMSASLLCADSVFANDWERASGYARQALAARDPHEVIFAETPRWPETAALVYAGDSEQASKDLHIFDECFGTNRRCRIVLARAQAVLAQSRGDSEQVIEYLREAIAGAKEIGLPGERWQAEAALGRVHLARSEHEQAEQAFMHAASAIKQLAGNITSDECSFRESFALRQPKCCVSQISRVKALVKRSHGFWEPFTTPPHAHVFFLARMALQALSYLELPMRNT
jgi:DNA-binding SARP family transcriptional activator